MLREGAREESSKHRSVEKWERLALFFGRTKGGEGLYFQTLAELTASLSKASFARWEIKPDGGRGSNVLLVAWTQRPLIARA